VQRKILFCAAAYRGPKTPRQSRFREKYYFNSGLTIVPLPFSGRIGGFILPVNEV